MYLTQDNGGTGLSCRFHGGPGQDKRDDTRSQEVKAEYVDIVQRIVGDHDIGTHNKAQIQPSGGYWANARRPYSRQASMVRDLNGEFDRFRR